MSSGGPTKQDGTPDMRYKENNDEAGNTGGSSYKPTEHDGLKKDGTPDKRTQPDHGFGGEDGPDPKVEGAKGGKSSGQTEEA